MHTERWYTFSEASRKINRNRNYFSNRFRLNPNFFSNRNVKIIGGIKFINDEGIENVLKRIKKTAVHQKNRPFLMEREALGKVASLVSHSYYTVY